MKKIIPLGDRLLVKRTKQETDTFVKDGLIVKPDTIRDIPTDIAEVVEVPEHSFADKELIKNAESIVNSLVKEAQVGDSNALKGLLEFNYYLKIKSIGVGDKVFMTKYSGIDYFDEERQANHTIVRGEDIHGVVVNG